MNTDDRYTRITLRLPRDLHERLSGSADATSKSMNAEIIARLESSFDEERHLAEIAAYPAWAEEHNVEDADQSIALRLARVRALTREVHEELRRIEELYDKKTGEHALAVDDNGDVHKNYEI